MCLAANAQVITKLTTNPKTNLRGLSVVDNDVVWVSGSKGMIGKSLNGGKTWKWTRVPNFENSDFRDIEAFDENTAIIMAVGEPGYILRTTDGGNKWKQVYCNTMHGIFLDAMEFWNEKMGIVVGDPINNKFVVARTYDGGKTWHDIDQMNYPDAQEGEACFAASGTNLRTLDEVAYFVTGGKSANLYILGQPTPLPINHGKQSAGANSIAIKDKNNFIIVGGDFDLPDATSQNACITKDGGKTWSAPQTPPHGYRSCVEYINKRRWITCGYNGVDYSKDDGRNWHNISNESYNVCRRAKKGTSVFLAGATGVIGKLEIPEHHFLNIK
ncbi:MAG: oxidoreductase [Ginsengibacter sp.]